MPEHTVNGTLKWHVVKDVALWLRGSWFSAQESTENGVPDYNSYGLFDLGASWDVTKNLRFNFGFYNILNKDMHGTRDYVNSVSGVAGTMQRYPTVEDGRRLWVSATFNF